MRKVLYLLAVIFGLAAVLVTPSCAGHHDASDGEQRPVRYEYGLPVDSFRIDTGVVRAGETLGGIFQRLGASQEQQGYVITLKPEDFDVRKVRVGKTYMALYRQDSTGTDYLCYWIYLSSIREADVMHLQDSFYVEKQVKPIRTQTRTAEVTIKSSLWNDMLEQNLPTDLVLELSEIYAWTIDFFALQKSDSIRVYYDEMYVDSTSIGIGRIHAANFYHGGKWQEAFYFEQGNTHSYFDGEGKSLKKAFLKAPLNYKRISSRFTYTRVHPIFKTVRPHTGVDYAAPAGTPVVSIGDGVVVAKGYKGGGGNTVKIKHNSTYVTAYLHLSRYGENIAVGKHVRQGQVIGYVGSTGNSTGPHLDFRVWKNGTPIDPLKMVSPPSEPVPDVYRAAFDSIVNERRQHL